MRYATRLAIVTAVLGGLCLLLLPVANSADEPQVESYQATGTARGINLAFTFKDSIFEKLIDLNLPYATADLRSEGSGQARAETAMFYPGDLVAGAAGEAFPGYTIATWPLSNGKPVDEEHEQLIGLPFPASVPLTAGVGNNHVRTSAKESLGDATLGRVVLGAETGPHLEIGSLHTESHGVLAADRVTQLVRTTVGNLAIVVSSDLTIGVRKLVSEIQTSSDGTTGASAASLTMSGVAVAMGGQTYDATIDNMGVHITGLPDGSPVPGFTPLALDRKLEGLLDQRGVVVTVGSPTQIVEGALAEASTGGLIVRLTGEIPVVPIPPVAALLVDQLRTRAIESLPQQLQDLVNKPICLQEDVSPDVPLPLCLGLEAIPGPGSGIVSSIGIGALQSASVAGVGFTDGGGNGGSEGGNGFGDGFLGGGNGTVIPPGNFGGSVAPPAGNQPAAPRGLTGLVAKLPSAALAGSGVGFLVLAAALGMGPSLRSWRRTT